MDKWVDDPEACCEKYSSMADFLDYYSKCLVCPKGVLERAAWCWAARCGWDDAECCPVRSFDGQLSAYCSYSMSKYPECVARCQVTYRTVGSVGKCKDILPSFDVIPVGHSITRTYIRSCSWSGKGLLGQVLPDPDSYCTDYCHCTAAQLVRGHNESYFGKETCG